MQNPIGQAQRTIQGVGLGLRACHYQHILTHNPTVPWFEVVTENYLAQGGAPLQYLTQISQRYPIVFHGVGLSLGSHDALNQRYLTRLQELITRFNPLYISDHLCWTSYAQQYFHELLPLPYTEKTIAHVADRIKRVQDFLGQRILLENVSSYVTYAASQMAEWEFINAVLEQADCYLLLDINNIYVSASNHGFEPSQYMMNITATRVKQMHLAGFQDCATHLLDSHGAPIHDAVWDLYKMALQHFGPVPTCIERDNAIPEFSELLQEADMASHYMQLFSKPLPLDAPVSYNPPVFLAKGEDVGDPLQKNIAQALNGHEVELQDLLTPAPLPAEQRLAIYRNSFTAALFTVLSDTYPVCRQLVGDDFFKAMIQVYVAQTPSYSPDIDEYGSSLAQFIRNFPAASALPYLADVATLEWSLHQVTRSATHPPFNTDALAQVAEDHYPQVVFKLPPGSVLLESAYPIYKIWGLHQAGYQGESEVDLGAGGVRLFIWQEAQTRIEVLTEERWLLLSALQQGLLLGVICAQLNARDQAIDVAALLSEFVGQGWLVDFEVLAQ